MKLSDLLVDAWVVAPAEGADLGSVLSEILTRGAGAGAPVVPKSAKLARDLAFGSQGEVVRINDEVVAVLGTLEELERVSVGLAVTPAPFRVTAEGAKEPRSARAVILVLSPGRITGPRQQVLPVLTRLLREGGRTERLLGIRSAAELRGMKEVMEAEVHPRYLVEDALLPVKYRVYPDTPVSEVLDLMVRREIRAVPVVGDRYEVLGILTSGDALAHLIRKGRPDGDRRTPSGSDRLVARDVMSRSVLCVSEDEILTEAANMMVNRDAEQLPVVRDGELIGFVTRDSILRVLYGTLDHEPNEDESDQDP
ncbi:MAG: CBS domain-containing protein [Longimicrobiales bacterium]